MSHLVIAVFVAVRIITSTGLRYRNHNQSFHNLIAHLRLRLDANMRSACSLTCVPVYHCSWGSQKPIYYSYPESRIETLHCNQLSFGGYV